MRRLAGFVGVLLLAGCTLVPALPPARVLMEAPEADAAAPSSDLQPVAGYGLATLGAREIIVRFAPSAQDRRPSRGVLKRRLRSGGAVYVLDSEAEAQEVLRELWADPEVLLAEPNVTMRPLNLPTDPLVPVQDWIGRINLPAAWGRAQGLGVASVTVGVVDSGADLTHEDLAANLLPTLGYDFFDDDADPTDTSGHGTHVSGLIAAVANNGKGGVGVAPGCKILPIRSLNQTGTIADVADGIAHAVSGGARVINLSLGTASDSPTLRAACDSAALAGVLLVAAAGNDGSTVPSYPGAYEACLCVGATTRGATPGSEVRASFSNHGAWVELAAPGQDILSTMPGGNAYDVMSGTSMATPIVAGAAALLRSLRPAWTPEQVEKALRGSGGTVTGFSGNPAIKRLDVDKALTAAAPVDTPPKVTTPVAGPSSTMCIVTASANEPVAPTLTLSRAADLSGATTYTLPTAATRIVFSPNNLVSNTKYFYRLSARDAANQVSNTAILSFTTAGPRINVATAKAGLYSASLAWTTSTPTNREVQLGLSATTLTTVDSAPATFQASHRCDLRGLLPNTTYHYRISGQAIDGSVLAPRTGTFKTGALTVKASATALTTNSAVIHVQTPAATYVTVRWGLSKTALTEVLDGSSLSTMHAVRLTGLRPGTPYFFSVEARDFNQNPVTSAVQPLTTLPVALLELAVTDVQPTSATFSCHSSVELTSKLFVGFSPSSLQYAGEIQHPEVNHKFVVNGLPPGQQLHAQVRGWDSGGHEVVSPIVTFMTPAQP